VVPDVAAEPAALIFKVSESVEKLLIMIWERFPMK
jgi:hypothetical protein